MEEREKNKRERAIERVVEERGELYAG